MTSAFKKPKVAKPEPVVQVTDTSVQDAADEEKKRLAAGQTPTLLTSGQGASADDTLLSTVQLGGDDQLTDPNKKKDVLLG